MEKILLAIIIFCLIVICYDYNSQMKETFVNVNYKHELYNQETLADINFKPLIDFKREHKIYNGIDIKNEELNDNIYHNNCYQYDMNINDLLIKKEK